MLPELGQQDFQGTIFWTSATKEIAEIVLLNAEHKIESKMVHTRTLDKHSTARSRFFDVRWPFEEDILSESVENLIAFGLSSMSQLYGP